MSLFARLFVVGFGVVVAGAALPLVACTSVVDNGNSSGGTSSGGTSGGTSGGNSSGGTSGTSGGGSKPPASTATVTVDVDGTCPSFTACGGSPQGTYDY